MCKGEGAAVVSLFPHPRPMPRKRKEKIFPRHPGRWAFPPLRERVVRPVAPESTSCEPNLLSLIEDCDVGIRSRATGDSWHGGGEGGPTRHGPRCCSCGLSWEISDMPHHKLLRGCRTKSACMALVRGDERIQAQPGCGDLGETTASARACRTGSFKPSVVLLPQ